MDIMIQNMREELESKLQEQMDEVFDFPNAARTFDVRLSPVRNKNQLLVLCSSNQNPLINLNSKTGTSLAFTIHSS